VNQGGVSPATLDERRVAEGEAPRILFYGHFASGLGHVVRSLRVADAAVKMSCRCALLTSYAQVDRLGFDPRIEVLELPQAGIEFDGRLTDGKHATERPRLIADLIERWNPDVVVTDHLPLGVAGELVEVLLRARDENWRTEFVWGIEDQARMDAGDEAQRIPQLPRSPRLRAALGQYSVAIAYSDAGWIASFEAFDAEVLPTTRHYAGVVCGRPDEPARSDHPLAVILAGAGAGADELLELALEAAGPLLVAGNLNLRCVAGPAAPLEAMGTMVAGWPNVELLAEASAQAAIRDAWVVVARSGYDTAYLLAQADFPVIFVPMLSSWNRHEQHFRANRLSDLPRIGMVEQGSKGAAELLRARLSESISAESSYRKLPFSIDGATNAARRLRATGKVNHASSVLYRG
jgi:predicted glycosyltransferase